MSRSFAGLRGLLRKRRPKDRPAQGKDAPALPTIPGTGLIDAEALARDYDMAHHKQAAERYFQSIGVDHPVMRKPFADAAETVQLLPGISATIDALGLFKGARVLDFGCGGGWLSRALASLGCEAVGVDYAASAADVARRASELDRFAGTVTFHDYDGRSLPCESESFDGAIVFDAFHHIPNQEELFAEFFRILKPGASVAFHEPGPQHSRLAQSQMEMRNFGVIERDMRMEAMERMAREAGFTGLALAMMPPKPLWLPLEEFEAAIAGDLGRIDWAGYLGASFHNLRIFRVTKQGEVQRDSRSTTGLSGALEIVSRERGAKGVALKLRLTNDGSATWRASGAATGSVNLGIQSGGDRDFRRVYISDAPVPPGESLEVELEAPADASLDLVAEGVAWFEQLTGATLAVSGRE